MKLVIYDIDDTLITSESYIGVKSKNSFKYVWYDSNEFRDYQYTEGDVLDTSYFYDLNVFERNVSPKREMIEQWKKDYMLYLEGAIDLCIITARAGTDDPERFKRILENIGVWGVSKVPVYFQASSTEEISSPKRVRVKELLDKKEYDIVEIYEDNEYNIKDIGEVVSLNNKKYIPHLVSR